MSMTVGPAEGGDEDEVVSAINTTPLVDVMLVLLIIFLITIPVVTQSIPVQLPKETNVVTQTKPENVLISVSRDGDLFWNTEYLGDIEVLVERLKKVSVLSPQPEVHIRGDMDARYESVGKVTIEGLRPELNLKFEDLVSVGSGPTGSNPGGWFKVDGHKVKLPGGRVRNSGGRQELLLDVPLKDGKASFTLEYVW